MSTMTPEAQQRLDRYMQQVRRSLLGSTVDAAEVERDVREHIEAELHSHPVPVAVEVLDGILVRLGSPEQWVPEDEISWWRRVRNRLIAGPEDWRLAYLCLGLTLLGVLTLPVGGLVLLAGAYLLARAAHARSVELGEPLESRRWLVYPVLVLLALTFAGTILLFLPWAGTAVGFEEGLLDRFLPSATHEPSPVREHLQVIGLGLAATGLWWLVVAGLVPLALRPLRWLLVPLAGSLRGWHALWLALLGAVAALAGLGALLL